MILTHTDGIEASILLAIHAGQSEYAQKKKAYLDQHEFDVEYSVTTLAQPPRMHQLKTRHPDKIVVDARRQYYSILGNLFHKIAEEYHLPGDITEERVGKIFIGKRGGKPIRILVHGASDRKNFQLGYLKDYKYTSMGSMAYEKTDYIQQLNLLRFLHEDELRSKITILSNIFMFRDFRYADCLTGRSREPTFMREVFYDVWDDEWTKKVLKDRLALHLRASRLADEDLPECTKEELWTSRSGFRVRHKTKAGEWGKNSSGWAPSEEEALVLTKKKETEWRLEPTEGKPKRCEWCGASSFCEQRLNYLKSLDKGEDHGDDADPDDMQT